MIHLASRSPRRRLLLDQIGIEYAVVDAPVDEVRRAGEVPETFVERMAREKAQAGLASTGGGPHGAGAGGRHRGGPRRSGAGKPRDVEHAMEMLHALSGRMHRVVSAVAIAGGNVRGPAAARDDRRPPDIDDAGRDSLRTATSISRVWFREIPHRERRAYCASGEPMDKGRRLRHPGSRRAIVARLDGATPA